MERTHQLGFPIHDGVDCRVVLFGALLATVGTRIVQSETRRVVDSLGGCLRVCAIDGSGNSG